MNFAAEFIAWCMEHHNNPDHNNLRWWLENRTPFGFPGDAEAAAILRDAKALKEML